ncbi:MAG: hypothetical protein HY077_05285 [Elusimicrobia bacterium]|nr:hypothetical protein [Elusimicrobiota bacterium]
MRALRLAAALLLMPLCAAARDRLNGFNIPCWSADCYSSPGARESLSRMAKTGAGWVALTPTWYQKTTSDSAPAAAPGTPSDESIRTAVRAAKAAGLCVAVKPHVDVENGQFRAFIHPDDPKAWFAAYGDMAAHYARLAAEERADMFVVGTELFRMDGLMHRRDWERVIARVRAVYPGPLTYAANWYDFSRVSFWDKLDFIGIDGYFPILNGHHKWAMKLEWLAYKPLIAAAAAVHGRPVLFTEFGLSSQKGAQRKPWEWKDFGPVDLEVQKNYFQSFLEVFGQESWFAGIWQWGWEINPDAGGPSDKSMTVQGKPALDVLKKYFARAKASPPPRGLSAKQKSALDSAVGRALLPLKSFP